MDYFLGKNKKLATAAATASSMQTFSKLSPGDHHFNCGWCLQLLFKPMYFSVPVFAPNTQKQDLNDASQIPFVISRDSSQPNGNHQAATIPASFSAAPSPSFAVSLHLQGHVMTSWTQQNSSRKNVEKRDNSLHVTEGSAVC